MTFATMLVLAALDLGALFSNKEAWTEKAGFDNGGEGHELKRMPEDWAFAITHDAFFLKPR